MSWSELERFVADVEADRALQWDGDLDQFLAALDRVVAGHGVKMKKPVVA